MKKTSLVLVLVVGIVVCSFAEAIAEEAARGDEKADLSYAFGMAVAADLKQVDLSFNYSAFMRGFKDIMEDQPPEVGMDEALEKVDNAIRAAIAEQAAVNKEKEAAFLAQNAARTGVYTTASGLQYEIIAEGSGEQPVDSDYVKVHYTGYLTDGTVFDSSYERGAPEEFPLMGVIPGWSEGILLMRAGGKSRLFVPSSLAYGAQGVGGLIPPNSVIIFEVELLEILPDVEMEAPPVEEPWQPEE